MMIRKYILITILACIGFAGFSQTKNTIDSLQKAEQNCLDQGKYMLGCAKMFYFQMDSMLNVVYLKLSSRLDLEAQSGLRTEQKLWLAKRDTYFKQTLKKFSGANPGISPYGSAGGAQDDAMFMYDDNAAFIKKRVLVLLTRL